MGLNVADIDRWDSSAINAVSQTIASRAEAASRATGTLGNLSAFQNWSGQGSASALQQTQARAADLSSHAQDSSAVATAARTAANEVSQVKSQLAALRSTAGAYGIVIDAATSRVMAPSVESLQAASKQLVETMVKNTQSAVDKLLQAADKADDLLAKAFEPGEKKKLLKKSKDLPDGWQKKIQKDFGANKDKDKEGKGAEDKNNKDGKDKPADSKDKKNSPSVKLYEKDVSAKVTALEGKKEGEHTFGNGAKVEGKVSGEVLSAETGANVEVNSDGISAGVNAKAVLAAGDIEGSAEYGIASVGGEAHAAVEASAEGTASLGKDGLNLEGEVFAGGRLTGDVHGEVGGVGVGGHGELQAGVGISGDANFGMKDGKLQIGASFGAALGIGGKVGFDVEIDPAEVTSTIKDGANKVADWFGF